MTFLSVTPDAFWEAAPAAAIAGTRAARSAPKAAHAIAALLAVAVLMVPAAVVEARWAKLTLVLGFMQHRCMASPGA